MRAAEAAPPAQAAHPLEVSRPIEVAAIVKGIASARWPGRLEWVEGRPSLLLDPIRTQWRAARPGDETALAQSIAQWQRALWRFTTVGHIGKRDGPKAWQVAVTPLAESREVRFKLSPPAAGLLGPGTAVEDPGRTAGPADHGERQRRAGRVVRALARVA